MKRRRSMRHATLPRFRSSTTQRCRHTVRGRSVRRSRQWVLRVVSRSAWQRFSSPSGCDVVVKYRPDMRTVTVAAVPIHALDMTEAIERIDGFIKARQPQYNVAINAAKVVEFQRDHELRRAIENAHL